MSSKTRTLAAALAVALAPAFGLAQGVAADGGPNLPTFDRRSPIVLAVENVGPAVVSIKTQTEQEPHRQVFDWFQRPEEPEVIDGHAYRERGQGSGVIVHPYGYVVTNNHVVWGADRITVTLSDGGAGRTLEATLINSDFDNDIAILKIKTPGPFPFARMGDSDKLYVGETTIALGNPFGLASSATTGILSAKNRTVNVRGEMLFKDFMQTSAIINPGNSGGPLLDINGYVIGINVAIDTRGPGIGYAIPINRVRDVAADLLDPEMVTKAWLGLEVKRDRGGLKVEHVAENGPAARAAIHKGDVIVGVGGRRVDDRLGLNIELLQYQPGAAVPLVVRRDRDVQVEVPFESVPAEEARVAGHRLDSVGLVVADITPVLARSYGLDARTRGVLITKVVPGSIADDMKLAAGDVVIQLGGYVVRDTGTMGNLLRAYAKRYGRADITVLRKGRRYSGPMPLT
jgi:serine protease Do